MRSRNILHCAFNRVLFWDVPLAGAHAGTNTGADAAVIAGL